MDEHQIPVQEKKTAEIHAEHLQRLNENENKELIALRNMNPEEYRNKDTRSKKEINRLITEINAQLQQDDDMAFEDKRMDVRVRLQKEADLQVAKEQNAIRDKKWYSLFDGGDSASMTDFKNAMNYLSNQLDREIPRDAEGNIDCSEIENIVLNACKKVFAACDAYKFTHEGKRHATGRRRLKKVEAVRKMVEMEKDRINELALSNIRDKVLFDQEHVKTLRDLLPRVAVNEAEISRFMEQGNSSDVFRVRLRAEGKFYYAKEDLKLLNEDFPGFLDRRLGQLQNSQAKRANQMKGLKSPQEYEAKSKEQDAMISSIDEILLKIKAKANPAERLAGEDAEKLKSLCEKLVAQNLMTQDRADKLMTDEDLSDVEADKLVYSIRKDQEELRLRGNIDDEDYQAGIDFLAVMKGKLASISDKKKNDEQKERYIKFLGHDFDRLFKELADYNSYLSKVNGNMEELKKTLEIMAVDLKQRKINNPADDPVYRMLKASLDNAAELKEKTAYEYICDLVKEGKMGLDLQKDQDVLDILKNLQQKGGERVQRLFTRTLGKEAELFGQQYERGGAGDSAILASNNTATSRLARYLGFTDVVTTSHKCLMKNRGDKNFKSYTLSEEAEGEEMLVLVGQAQKEGATLQYSPNAVRQLMRLQLFDTLCLQTDRHWRNFKCKVTKVGKKWTIESLKSYDHDQSFGTKTLKDYFKEQEESMGQKGQMGFLNPYVMTISKDDKRYTYLREHFIGSGNDHVLDSIKVPNGDKFRFKLRGKARDKKKVAKDGTVAPYDVFTFVGNSYFNRLTYVSLDRYKELIRQGNPGKEAVADKFSTEFEKLRDIWVEISRQNMKDIKTRKDEKPGKEGYSQTGVVRQLREVKRLYDQLDLSGMEKMSKETGIELENRDFYQAAFEDRNLDLARRDGFFDYMVQSVMHCIKMRFAMNPDTLTELQKEDREDYIKQRATMFQKNNTTEEQIRKKQDMCGIGTDTLRIPTMLHMDKDAYDKIREVANDAGAVDNIMRELAWPKSKREALIERAKQLVEQIEEAAQIADAWYENWNENLQNPNPDDKTWEREKDPRYIPKTDIRRKFFLEYKEEKVVENGVEKTNVVQDDYKLITNLTDFATDPSMTYFSIEDPNFLAGEKEYAKHMNAKDRADVVKTSNRCRSHVRQRDDLEQLKNFVDYKPLVGNQVG